MGDQNQKISVLDSIFGIFQKSVEFTKKYSVVDLIKGLFALIISCAIIFLFINPTFILDKYDQLKNQQHTNEIEKRLNVSPKINFILEKLLVDTKCDRSFILEMHNGSSNLNNMPFLYCDLTYEQCAIDSLEYVSDLYQNVPLARFSIIQELFNNGYWYGTVEELAEIDKRLSSRIKINSGEWIALILLKGKEQYLGIIGVSYTNANNVQKEAVGKHLRTAAINTIALLDN